MGASYNTILVPALDRNAILGAVGSFLGEHGAKIVRVENQMHSGAPFATNSAKVVLFGSPSASGWLPVSSWADGLIAYPTWYQANPLAASLSRSASLAIYLFSVDSGFVAGYTAFVGGGLVEGQTVPWKDGESVGPDFDLPVSAPGHDNRLRAALNDADFDYVRFIRRFPSVEEATGALMARFGLDCHLMDPLDMLDGRGLALVDGQYVDVPLTGWSCITYGLAELMKD